MPDTNATFKRRNGFLKQWLCDRVALGPLSLIRKNKYLKLKFIEFQKC